MTSRKLAQFCRGNRCFDAPPSVAFCPGDIGGRKGKSCVEDPVHGFKYNCRKQTLGDTPSHHLAPTSIFNDLRPSRGIQHSSKTSPRSSEYPYKGVGLEGCPALVLSSGPGHLARCYAQDLT